MPETRNLCAQLPLDLHQRVCEAREQLGLSTAQYIRSPRSGSEGRGLCIDTLPVYILGY